MNKLFAAIMLLVSSTALADTWDITEAITRRGNSWDLNAEVGYGHSVGPHLTSVFFGRVSGGYLRSFDPLFIHVDAFFDVGAGTGTYFAPGIMIGATHSFSALWMEMGGMHDFGGRTGGAFSAGFSLVGLEADVWSQPGSAAYQETNLIVKLRVPIGMLYFLQHEDLSKPE